MARKKDLAGLATLAGLAYMASRDKAASGDVPVEDRTGTATGFMNEKEPGWDTKGSEYGTEKEPGWDTKPSTAAPARSTPHPAAKAKPKGEDYGNEGRRPVKEASSKTTYETPYDRMNRLNREAAQDKADTDAETRKLRSAHPAPGRGVIDTKNIRENTLLPMKKGGSVKGWGIARGARKAKTY